MLEGRPTTAGGQWTLLPRPVTGRWWDAPSSTGEGRAGGGTLLVRPVTGRALGCSSTGDGAAGGGGRWDTPIWAGDGGRAVGRSYLGAAGDGAGGGTPYFGGDGARTAAAAERDPGRPSAGMVGQGRPECHR